MSLVNLSARSGLRGPAIAIPTSRTRARLHIAWNTPHAIRPPELPEGSVL